MPPKSRITPKRKPTFLRQPHRTFPPRPDPQTLRLRNTHTPPLPSRTKTIPLFVPMVWMCHSHTIVQPCYFYKRNGLRSTRYSPCNPVQLHATPYSLHSTSGFFATSHNLDFARTDLSQSGPRTNGPRTDRPGASWTLRHLDRLPGVIVVMLAVARHRLCLLETSGTYHGPDTYI